MSSLIGYGATQLLVERLMLSSDRFDTQVCEKCGMLAYKGWCKGCGDGESISSITLPYAAKLMMQEVSARLGCRADEGNVWADEQLMAMNIMPKLCLEDTV